ncbi:MAG: hypothetical protein RRB13_11860 [bacterium]|nr:hypothetical protein [bacterium]
MPALQNFKRMKLGSFLVERVIALSGSEKLGPQGTGTEQEGLRLLMGLHDSSDFGNSGEGIQDKDAKLAALQAMFQAHKTGDQGTTYPLVHMGLNALGYTDVRIRRLSYDLRPQGSKSWYLVTLELEVVNDPQQRRVKKDTPMLKGGGEIAERIQAAAAAASQGAIEQAKKNSLLASIDANMASFGESIGLGG